MGVEVQKDKSKKGKKMKTLCILLFFGATLIKAHENDFEVVVKNDSILEPPSAVSLPTLSQPVPQTAQTKTARLHALSDVVSSCRSAEHIRVVLWQLAAAQQLQPQQQPRR